MNKIIFIFVLIFAASCTVNKNVSEQSSLKYKIDKIEYKTSGCFGTCPQFQMEINSDRKAVFTAKRFNFSKDFSSQGEMEGVFETTLDKDAYNEIVSLLNEMDFPNLKTKYAVEWTDDQTAELKISYNSDRQKFISDYGLKGNLELEKLHKLIFDLRTNQKWNKIK